MKNEGKKKNEGLRLVLNTIAFFIVFFLLWNVLAEVDYRRCARKKEPLLPVNVITNQYENGTITEYICIGYRVIEYQLENKKDVWELVSSIQPIDTENLVDKYLEEKKSTTNIIEEDDINNEVTVENATENNITENNATQNNVAKNNILEKNNIENDTTD